MSNLWDLFHISQECSNASLRACKTVPDHCETRVRPQRLAARRANELLCIVGRYETSSEDADWFDEDEVDASGLTIPEPSSSALQVPVMKESEWLANPWTEEQ